MPPVPGSLRALLANLIDYAGLFPPESLPLDEAVGSYTGYFRSPDRWILNRFVLPAAQLSQVVLKPAWRVTLLVDEPPGDLPPQVESLETRRLDLDSALPVYYEAPLARIAHGFAKIRTGGLTSDAIPSCAALARFLYDAAARRVPFKATAGLHHAVRAEQALTYAPDSPRAPMHGFVNVFLAASFAWRGADVDSLADILKERDAAAFVFQEDAAGWRDLRLSAAEIAASRRDFAHSFGSCSFEQPVAELRNLKLL
jgi:hypothetical protein